MARGLDIAYVLRGAVDGASYRVFLWILSALDAASVIWLRFSSALSSQGYVMLSPCLPGLSPVSNYVDDIVLGIQRTDPPILRRTMNGWNTNLRNMTSTRLLP